MPNGPDAATPEEILRTCVRLEQDAAALYRRFQAAAPDPALRSLWATMAHEKGHHGQLIEGVVEERVAAIRREADIFDLHPDRMLSITAALEFSEMDDLFDAVCRANGLPPDVGRASHLRPLVEAVLDRRSEVGVLRHMLAAMFRLRRRAGRTAPRLEEDEVDSDDPGAVACDD